MLQVEANVTSENSYDTVVSTTSDCQVGRAKYYLLFYSRTGLENQGYAVNTETLNLTDALGNSNLTQTLCCPNNSYLLLGLSSFHADSALTGYLWSMEVTSTDNQLTLTLRKTNFLSISYSLLQLGPSPAPSTPASLFPP
jgi:hypothetical protein